MKSICRRMMLLALVCLASASAAYAQASGSTAELRGQVTDTAGAAVAGATVTLTDFNKGTERTATTDAEGNYKFLGLLPSPDDVKVRFNSARAILK